MRGSGARGRATSSGERERERLASGADGEHVVLFMARCVTQRVVAKARVSWVCRPMLYERRAPPAGDDARRGAALNLRPTEKDQTTLR